MPDHDLTLVDCSAAHAEILASLHAECFDNAWSAQEILALLISPGLFGCIAEYRSEPAGFILGRAVADECEILTLGVLPPLRRHGIAARLLEKLTHEAAELEIVKIFLEVAADNEAAKNLYYSRDFVEIGRRKNYYNSLNGRHDALIFAKTKFNKTANLI